MSLRDVLCKIQNPVKVATFLCHVSVESLDLRHNTLPVQVVSPKPRKYICSASCESGGRSTEGEQYAAWPPVYLYLWFDQGMYK
jgi:hypothetical protein